MFSVKKTSLLDAVPWVMEREGHLACKISCASCPPKVFHRETWEAQRYIRL